MVIVSLLTCELPSITVLAIEGKFHAFPFGVDNWNQQRVEFAVFQKERLRELTYQEALVLGLYKVEHLVKTFEVSDIHFSKTLH